MTAGLNDFHMCILVRTYLCMFKTITPPHLIEMDEFISAAVVGVASIPADQWAMTLRSFNQAHEGQYK